MRDAHRLLAVHASLDGASGLPAPVGRRALFVLAFVIAIVASPARSHEVDKWIPEDRGVAFGAALSGGWLHGSRPLPAPRLGGVTSPGDMPRDGRGWRVEHATAGLGIRLSPWLSGAFAAGIHDGDPAHVEAAWLQASWQGPSADHGERDLALGLGRNRVPTGSVIETAGHLDRFSQMPLAKRSAFNGQWIEDGISMKWRPHPAAFGWLQTVDVGLWRGRRFPGAQDGSPIPLLHLRAGFGPIAVDGFVSRLRPEGRGAFIQRQGQGHVHAPPRCDRDLRGFVCFDGTVDLAGASLEWTLPVPGLRLVGAAIHRRERGLLTSPDGDTRYRGRSTGGWIDLIWAPGRRWELGTRHEWLTANHRLQGIGATRVASQAGLLPYEPSRRTMLLVAYRVSPDLRVGVEGGRESVAGSHATVLGLRLLWTPPMPYQRDG